MPDLLIRGGSVVTPGGVVQADIAVENQQIAAIGPGLPGCEQEVDARGLTILPGLIDVHVHFNEPGRTDWEGSATGSRALAAGGGTLFFDMPLNSSPCTLNRQSFDAKVKALKSCSITDFAIWGGLVPGNLDALEELAGCGVIGFKAFMADSGLPELPRSDHRTLLEGMRRAARLKLPVAVHAESEELTRRPPGLTGIADYLTSRPVLAELEAIQSATLMAQETGVRLHIVHVSSGRGVALAAEARARGVDVSIETCPHYLFFTEEDLLRLGAVAKCAPPLRTEEDRQSLWSNLANVDIIASDHSPCAPNLKHSDDFFSVWGGISGVQTTLAVLLESGDIPLERIASLTAEAPARRFNISGKGRLEPGLDADLSLVDLNDRFTLESGNLFYRHKVTPYLGYSFHGRVRRTVLRGQTIFEDGKIVTTSLGEHVQPGTYA